MLVFILQRGESVIRCNNGSVHSGGYREAFGFTLTGNEICLERAEDEAGGTCPPGTVTSLL